MPGRRRPGTPLLPLLMANTYSNLYGTGFPARYVQGPAALNELKGILRDCLGAGSALLIYDAALEQYMPRFNQSGVAIHAFIFPGNCSDAAIDDLTAAARNIAADCVIGFGGGKTLDTAKAVAANLNLPMVIMPSAASNDAPTSRLVAIYEEHVFKHSRVLARNPDLVLVDTSILAEAPRRLLVAGIGDALSKKFEVDCSVANSVPNTFGMQSLLLSRTLADRCYELIRLHAISAIGECEAQRPGENFERLVEACVLYSGLAFEGGGLSLAHGLLRGLTCMPETERFLHGELVAYGSLVQVLACQRQRDEFDELLGVVKAVGLPSCLRDFGVSDISKERLSEVAAQTLTAPYLAGGAQQIFQDDIVQAMLELERRTA